MKSVVFITCILAIVRVNEAITGKEFRNDLAECEKELPKTPNLAKELNPNVIICTLKKVGALDDTNPIDENKFISLCEALISDPTKVQQCKSIINICFDTVQGNTASSAQKLKFVSCGVAHNVVALFDS